LSVFDVQRVKDKSGKDIIPPVAFDTGLTRSVLSAYDYFKRILMFRCYSSHPKPYDCKIELRGQWVKTLLDEAEIEIGRDN
jgi:hypothetical protein